MQDQSHIVDREFPELNAARRRRRLSAAAAVLTSLVTVACGSSGDPAGTTLENPTVGTGPLMPFKVGNVWNYRVTDSSGISDKSTTIEKEELVGGTGPHAGDMAYKVVTRKGTSDQTDSWQLPVADEPDKVVRMRELSYGATSMMPNLDTWWEPYKLHVDGRAATLVQDYTWLETYDETKDQLDGTAAVTATQHDRWTVVSIDESVVVAGKTYEHAVHFQKFSNAAKDYWFLRGVGKLKETGTQTEELLSYQITE
jgi:hypothetical protein